jgi:hypothetical protein
MTHDLNAGTLAAILPPSMRSSLASPRSARNQPLSMCVGAASRRPALLPLSTPSPGRRTLIGTPLYSPVERGPVFARGDDQRPDPVDDRFGKRTPAGAEPQVGGIGMPRLRERKPIVGSFARISTAATSWLSVNMATSALTPPSAGAFSGDYATSRSCSCTCAGLPVGESRHGLILSG